MRLGGDRELHFGGRIVAATHRPVDDPDARTYFRADLYHRLAACVLRVAPLRDRREDIPALAQHLLARSLAELPGAPSLDIDPDAVRWLQAADWPGNVRELSNTLRGAIARALVRSADRVQLVDVAGLQGSVVPYRPSEVLAPEAAPSVAAVPAAPAPRAPVTPRWEEPPPGAAMEPVASPADGPLAEAMTLAQQARVHTALAACHGNKAAAARRLGVSRQWLHRLLARWENA